MRYMLLIYNDEKLAPVPGTPAFDKQMADYGTFTEQLVASGAMRAGDPLGPVAMSTTVRVRDGKTLSTDGPFAETKEQLGGYYIVEVDDIAKAVSIAAMIPGSLNGSIEIRPIMEM